jgi:hypothetical protein
VPSTIVLEEQVIQDLPTGITIRIRRTAAGEGRIWLEGDGLPFGNRDLQFDEGGKLVGSGTAVGVCAHPL